MENTEEIKEPKKRGRKAGCGARFFPPIDLDIDTDEDIVNKIKDAINTGKAKDKIRVKQLAGIFGMVLSATKNMPTSLKFFVGYPYKRSKFVIANHNNLKFLKDMVNNPLIERIINIYLKLHPNETDYDSVEDIEKMPTKKSFMKKGMEKE